MSSKQAAPTQFRPTPENLAWLEQQTNKSAKINEAINFYQRYSEPAKAAALVTEIKKIELADIAAQLNKALYELKKLRALETDAKLRANPAPFQPTPAKEA